MSEQDKAFLLFLGGLILGGILIALAFLLPVTP